LATAGDTERDTLLAGSAAAVRSLLFGELVETSTFDTSFAVWHGLYRLTVDVMYPRGAQPGIWRLRCAYAPLDVDPGFASSAAALTNLARRRAARVACPPVSEARTVLGEQQQVIALVASAGGLEAVSTVLEGLPKDLRAAVVVLIHQPPDRESALVPILQRRSRLPVVAAQDDEPLAAGTVVVAPPGKHTLVTGGPRIALIVSGASPPSRPSADLLLATLATACGALATAVVLSGGGHDGATGATAIHRLGGTVIASSEATSTHFAMPQATIERDHAVDHIAEVNDIADVLRTIVNAADRSIRGEV
jgi:two-component system chemotaxis response regulator CheB